MKFVAKYCAFIFHIYYACRRSRTLESLNKYKKGRICDKHFYCTNLIIFKIV